MNTWTKSRNGNSRKEIKMSEKENGMRVDYGNHEQVIQELEASDNWRATPSSWYIP